MADTYMNTSGHPIDTDDGRVIAAGEVAEFDTRGPLVKAAIEAGQFVAAGQEANQRDVDYTKRREPIEYEDLTVDELQAEASARDLSTAGKKADLVKRLKAQDAEEGNQ